MPYWLNMAHGFYPVICTRLMQSSNAGRRTPVNCSCNAPIAVTQNGGPVPCGHRSCPQCQNHEASLWLDRQQAKLLPVEYFMSTFTLPYELRVLTWDNQKLVYDLYVCLRFQHPERLRPKSQKPGRRDWYDRYFAYAQPPPGLSPPYSCGCARGWCG